MGTVVCCLIAYGIMVNRTAADFSSDVDLATQYRALLSAHEETKITVDALKRDAMVPAAKVDASLVSLQQDLNKMTDAVEQAAMARATLLKAHSNMQASVKKMETETSTTSKELQKKAAELQAKTQEHLRELTTTLDSLKQQFEAIRVKISVGSLARFAPISSPRLSKRRSRISSRRSHECPQVFRKLPRTFSNPSRRT